MHDIGRQDLPAPAGVHHPRGVVEQRSVIVFALLEKIIAFPVRTGAVHAHADAHFPDLTPIGRLECPLDPNCSLERIPFLEYNQETVPAVLQDPTP